MGQKILIQDSPPKRIPLNLVDQSITEPPTPTDFEYLVVKSRLKASFGNFPTTLSLEHFNRFLLELPDTPEMYTSYEEAKSALTRHSKLETYLISLMPQSSTLAISGYESVSDGLPVKQSICLGDKIRTKKFLLAIKQAIEVLERKVQGDIYVLDAGSGVIPVLSLYAAMCSKRVRCTALELNPNSYRIAKEFIESLGFQNRIDIEQADAIRYCPNGKVHLLVSETMRSSLNEEPMVQIMGNLSRYLATDGIILPSKVILKAGFLRYDKDEDRPRVIVNNTIGLVVEPDWKENLTYNPYEEEPKQINFSLNTNNMKPGTYYVTIGSDIFLGDSIKLTGFDSSLSCPIRTQHLISHSPTFKLDEQNVGKMTIKINYRPGSHGEILYSVLSH